MLWFNFGVVGTYSAQPEFQYILCCGSTCFAFLFPCFAKISIHLMLWFNAHPSEIITYVKDFNTSYVVVQRWILQRALIYFIISIHLMLWFNICFRLVQYIHIPHFNTSYVVVQQIVYWGNVLEPVYFNTSYVVVQHML